MDEDKMDEVVSSHAEVEAPVIVIIFVVKCK